MLYLLVFLLLAVFCLSVLIRAFLLFPLRALRHGWAPALRRYGLSLLLCRNRGFIGGSGEDSFCRLQLCGLFSSQLLDLHFVLLSQRNAKGVSRWRFQGGGNREW